MNNDVLKEEFKYIHALEAQYLEEILSLVNVKSKELDYFDYRILIETIQDYGDKRIHEGIW